MNNEINNLVQTIIFEDIFRITSKLVITILIIKLAVLIIQNKISFNKIELNTRTAVIIFNKICYYAKRAMEIAIIIIGLLVVEANSPNAQGILIVYIGLVSGYFITKKLIIKS